MSQLAVIYELKANLIGLKPSDTKGLPEGVNLYGLSEIVKVRARDPPNKQGITQEATGATKGALFNSTGPCTVSGHIPSDVAMIKSEVHLILFVNNA